MKIHKHRYFIGLITFILIILLAGISLALLEKIILGTEGVSIFCLGGSIRQGATEKVCDAFPSGSLTAPKTVKVGDPITLKLTANDDFGITKIGVNYGGGSGGEWHSCRCDNLQTEDGRDLPPCNTPFYTESGEVNCVSPAEPGGYYSVPQMSSYRICKECDYTWTTREWAPGTYRYVTSIGDDNKEGHTAEWACYPDGAFVARANCEQDCKNLKDINGQSLGYTDGYNRKGPNFCNPTANTECMCYKMTEPYMRWVTVTGCDRTKNFIDGSNSHCSSPTPYCSFNNDCVECLWNDNADGTSTHCPNTKPYCSGNKCVECIQRTDCKGTDGTYNTYCPKNPAEARSSILPSCSGAHVCICETACDTNTECATNFCCTGETPQGPNAILPGKTGYTCEPKSTIANPWLCA